MKFTIFLVMSALGIISILSKRFRQADMAHIIDELQSLRRVPVHQVLRHAVAIYNKKSRRRDIINLMT